MTVRLKYILQFGILLLCLLAAPACGEHADEAVPRAEDPMRAELRLFWGDYARATQLRTSGKPLDAARAYRDALERNKAHEDSLYYLAICLMDTGSYKDAVQVLERLVAQNPSSHRGYFQLGVALSTPMPGAELDFPRARRAFERNIEINREESGPFLRLGELELCLGHGEEARRYFDTAAGFQSPEGLFRTGFVRYIEGQYGAASRMFRRVLELNTREKAISGRGVQSEGDVASRSGSLTPLERSGLQSLFYLYWLSHRSASNGPDLGGTVQIHAPPSPAAPFRFIAYRNPRASGVNVVSVRDMWDESWRPLLPGDPARYLEPLDSGVPKIAWPPASLEIAGPLRRPMALGEAAHPVIDLKQLDLDADGRLDLLSLSWKGGIRVYRNTGPGTYQEVEASGLAAENFDSFAMAVLDFDQDNYPDVLVAPYAPYADVLAGLAGEARPSRYSLRLYRNLGSGKFKEVHIPGLDGAHGVIRALPADFDGDGFPDLLLAAGGLDPFRLEPSIVLHNEGGRAFKVAAWLPGFDRPVRALGATTADFDGDRRPDICLRTTDGLLFFRNTLRP